MRLNIETRIKEQDSFFMKTIKDKSNPSYSNKEDIKSLSQSDEFEFNSQI